MVDGGCVGTSSTRPPSPSAVRDLEVVKLAEAKRGFMLLPKRWIVKRDLAWSFRLRRLARDDERLPTVLAGLHFVAFACLMLAQFTPLLHGTSRP